MIVENIHDYTAVVAVSRMQAPAAKPGNGMRIGKRVDGAVQHYPVLNRPRKVFIFIAANTVGYKIPDCYFIISEGKVNVS
jgi:hypothetical protein